MMKIGSISRYTMIGGALSLAGLFIFGWMVQLQNSKAADTFRKQYQASKYANVTYYPERGNIYDRWGHLLAGNIETYEIGVDLQNVKDSKTIATTLAQMLGLEYQATLNAITLPGDNTQPRYVPLAYNVSAEKIDQIDALKKSMRQQALEADGDKGKTMPSLAGVSWRAHLQRSYPEHEMGSTLLGFYNYLDPETGQGYYGVEEKYNSFLAGKSVTLKVPNDPNLIEKPPEIKPGVSLVLTIDRDIQAMAEEVLDKAVADNGAQSGTMIIMDPRNGELLAMASTPRMDLNNYWDYTKTFPDANTPFNRAIGTTYEPGSVFKVLTMSAAIDAGKVRPDTPFLDTGVIYVGGVPIYNWDRGAWGPQDMIGCMQHSLNVCLSWVATELGPTSFYDYMQRFGIGHMTGIDLAGEVNYPMSVQGDEDWYMVNLATNSFGQGVAVTPIQMITAIGAVANNQGKMMAPHILKATIDDGKQYNNPPQVIGTPITAQAASTMTEMLRQSLEKESSVALAHGYSVAGKTGTAEIPGPGGYLSDTTNASFVGWGPTDDPRFIIYIWLERPTSSPWGSVVAAPVFSETVTRLAVLLDLPPDDVRQALANGQKAASPQPAEPQEGQ